MRTLTYDEWLLEQKLDACIYGFVTIVLGSFIFNLISAALR